MNHMKCQIRSQVGVEDSEMGKLSGVPSGTSYGLPADAKPLEPCCFETETSTVTIAREDIEAVDRTAITLSLHQRAHNVIEDANLSSLSYKPYGDMGSSQQASADVQLRGVESAAVAAEENTCNVTGPKRSSSSLDQENRIF